MTAPTDKPAALQNVVSFADARRARGQAGSGLSAADLAELEDHFAAKEFGGTLLPAGSGVLMGDLSHEGVGLASDHDPSKGR